MSKRQSVVKTVRWAAVFLAAVAAAATGRGEPPATKPAPGQMRLIKTRYYDIYTDLDDETAREAAVRMTAMAEEYARRIRGFGVTVTRRLPFHLFSRAEDYHKAGGPANSWGFYLGTKLMATASRGDNSRTWYMIQHEGFHQFLDAAMRSKVPTWLNEGLAEYFGHAIWTGDGFVMGAVPDYRRMRVQERIKLGKTLDMTDLLKMEFETWNEQMSTRNYDQAWALVYFLIHGEDGKYRKPLGRFLTDLGAGRPWEPAFVRHFGRDANALEKRHNAWWLSPPLSKGPQVHATAVVQTLTSFLARAVAKRQKIKDFADFRARGAAGKLLCPEEQWLPGKLLANALAASGRYRNWQIKRVRAYPSIVLDSDGIEYTGTFTVRRGRAAQVTVTTKPARKKK